MKPSLLLVALAILTVSCTTAPRRVADTAPATAPLVATVTLSISGMT